MPTKKKLTKKRILKGGNPVRESPWMYRVPASYSWIKESISEKMSQTDMSRSEIITQALDHYFNH